MEKVAKPNIYEYNDYREFLRDLYHFYKNKNPQTFSFRILSERAGLGSPNYFHLVMEGKRNLSSKMIPRFAQALKLENQQQTFFEHLVHFTQAKSVEEKNTYFKNLMRFREYRIAAPLQSEQYQYLSHWYYVTIREMVALKSFKEDPEWIAEVLNPSITARQAKEAIRILLSLGLLKRNDSGELEQSQSHLATHETIATISAYHFHRQMILNGLGALNAPADQRDISSMTLALPRSRLSELKKKIYEFFYEIQAWLETIPENPDTVYQFNFQLFQLMQSGALLESDIEKSKKEEDQP